MISEIKISKTELQGLIADRIRAKEQKNVDPKDVKFKCDYDFEFEYAFVIIDLGE